MAVKEIIKTIKYWLFERLDRQIKRSHRLNNKRVDMDYFKDRLFACWKHNYAIEFYNTGNCERDFETWYNENVKF